MLSHLFIKGFKLVGLGYKPIGMCFQVRFGYYLE